MEQPVDSSTLPVVSHPTKRPERSERDKSSSEESTKRRPLVPANGKSFILEILPMFTINPSFMKIHSTFFPSARALYVTLDRVYNRLSHLRGFRETYQASSPYPRIRMYYAYAFYIRILTVMRSFNALSHDQDQVLNAILASYPLSSFKIAEPLVPFFEALCGFNPADGRFGPVYPTLPEIPSSAARHGALSNEAMLLFPNFVSIAKVCNAITLPLPADSTIPYFGDIDDPTGQAVIPYAHNAPGLNAYKKTAIGSDNLGNNPYAGKPVRHLVRETMSGDQYVPCHNIGPGIPRDSDVSTWMSYLLLSHGTSHIGRLAADSEFMNFPFIGNRTLADMPTVDGPYGSVTFSYDNGGVAFAKADSSRAPNAPVLSLQGRAFFHEAPEAIASAQSSGKFISNDQALKATITQINVTFPKLYAPGSDNVGAHNGTRFGPYWDPTHLNTFGSTPALNTGDHLDSVINANLASARLDGPKAI